MMNQQARLGYASDQGWQAVELRYAASELAMRVIVPREARTPAELLSPQTLAEIQTGLRAQLVDLFLPRWDFATEVNLLPALNTLGLTAVDDFSGISEAGLGLGQAVHRPTGAPLFIGQVADPAAR